MKARLSVVSFALVATGGCLLAHAVDYPKRKPGLWELTRSAPNPKFPAQVSRICLDATTDALFYQFGVSSSRKLCGKLDMHTVGSQFVIDAVCTIGASEVTSRTTFTFHGDNAYHQETTVHHDSPSSDKRADSLTTLDAKWLGACTADMKPGDLVTQPSALLPTSMRMNILDMMRAAK